MLCLANRYIRKLFSAPEKSAISAHFSVKKYRYRTTCLRVYKSIHKTSTLGVPSLMANYVSNSELAQSCQKRVSASSRISHCPKRYLCVPIPAHRNILSLEHRKRQKAKDAKLNEGPHRSASEEPQLVASQGRLGDRSASCSNWTLTLQLEHDSDRTPSRFRQRAFAVRRTKALTRPGSKKEN